MYEYNWIILLYMYDSHKVLWFYESREVVIENRSLHDPSACEHDLLFAVSVSASRPGAWHGSSVPHGWWMLLDVEWPGMPLNAFDIVDWFWLILSLFFPKSYSYSIPVFKWQNATTIHLLKVSQKWDSLCFPKVTSSLTGCQELVGYRIGSNWIQNDICRIHLNSHEFSDILRPWINVIVSW